MFRTLRVRHALLHELEHRLHMRQYVLDAGRVLEAGDDARICLQDAIAKGADVLHEIDVEL